MKCQNLFSITAMKMESHCKLLCHFTSAFIRSW